MRLLPQIGLKQFALLTFEAAYGLLFYLTDTLACQIELGAYLLKGHFLASYAEKHLEDFALPFVELTEGAVHFL